MRNKILWLVWWLLFCGTLSRLPAQPRGTVTSVSCVSGCTVANHTTTPAITVTASGGSPAGSAGCVQLYGTSTTFAGCVGNLEAKVGTLDAGENFFGVGGVLTDAGTAGTGFLFNVTPIADVTGTIWGSFQAFNLETNFNYTTPIAEYTALEADGTGAVGVAGNPAVGLYGSMYFAGNTSSGYGAGVYGYVQAGEGTIHQLAGVWSQVNMGGSGGPGATVSNAYNYYAQATTETQDLGSITNKYAYWTEAQAGNDLTTNAFDFWADEQGAYVIHAINTFNSVYQARPALYNPQVTKFVPEATNFERCIPGCQWESNVAFISTEAGGTGTLRPIEIDSGTFIFGSNAVTHAGSGTRFLCISTTGVVTSSASACSGT